MASGIFKSSSIYLLGEGTLKRGEIVKDGRLCFEMLYLDVYVWMRQRSDQYINTRTMWSW